MTDDEDFSKVAHDASSTVAMPPPETPRKAIKTDILSTPGKRGFEEMNVGNPLLRPTPMSADREDDVFTTPATNGKGNNIFMPTTPQDTPTPVRFKDMSSAQGGNSSLANEVLTALQDAKILLPAKVGDDIKAICNKQNLFTHGVIKGRDVSRSLIAKRDEKIIGLQGTIEALQAERETSRAVIRHLRKETGITKSNSK